MIGHMPGLKDLMAHTQDPDMPHYRCFLFFKYRDDPAKLYHPRCHSWCEPVLREVCNNENTKYSREAAELVIPQLLNEINVLREPQQTKERFSRILGLGPFSPGVPENGAKTR